MTARHGDGAAVAHRLAHDVLQRLRARPPTRRRGRAASALRRGRAAAPSPSRRRQRRPPTVRSAPSSARRRRGADAAAAPPGRDARRSPCPSPGAPRSPPRPTHSSRPRAPARRARARCAVEPRLRGRVARRDLPARGWRAASSSASAAAEAVADDVDPLEVQCVQRVHEIADVCPQAPRRLPVREPVSAKVGSEDVESRQARLGESSKPPAPARDAVKAEDRSPVRAGPSRARGVSRTRNYRRARGALRHPCEPAGARSRPRGCACEGRDRVPARRRPRRLRSVPARDVRSGARDRRADDLHPRQRRALAARAARRSAGDRRRTWRSTCARFSDEEIEWLYRLPERAEVDGVVYVHGCWWSDVDSFAREPQDADELARRARSPGGRSCSGTRTCSSAGAVRRTTSS